MKKFVKTNEFVVLLTVIGLCLLIGIKNPVFFTAATVVSLMKNCIVMGIMTFGLLPGIIIGGIDVSFPAIAVCSMYLTSKLMDSIGYSGPVIVPILMAIGIGIVLGGLLGALITYFSRKKKVSDKA